MRGTPGWLGELPETPLPGPAFLGSFDCVVLRFAQDNSAQDDSGLRGGGEKLWTTRSTGSISSAAAPVRFTLELSLIHI